MSDQDELQQLREWKEKSESLIRALAEMDLAETDACPFCGAFEYMDHKPHCPVLAARRLLGIEGNRT